MPPCLRQRVVVGRSVLRSTGLFIYFFRRRNPPASAALYPCVSEGRDNVLCLFKLFAACSIENQREPLLSLRSESARGCQRPPSPTPATGASAKRPLSGSSVILDLPRPPPTPAPIPPRPLLSLRLLPRLPLPLVRPSLLLLRLRLGVPLSRRFSRLSPRPPPRAPFMESLPLPSSPLSLLLSPESRRSLPLPLRFLPPLECLWLLFLWRCCFLCLVDLWCLLDLWRCFLWCFFLSPSSSSLPDPLSLLLLLPPPPPSRRSLFFFLDFLSCVRVKGVCVYQARTHREWGCVRLGWLCALQSPFGGAGASSVPAVPFRQRLTIKATAQQHSSSSSSSSNHTIATTTRWQ